MKATASNVFFIKHLFRCGFFNQAISLFKVDRVEQPDSTEVDDVLEIPTDKDVYATHRGQSHVKRVGQGTRSDHAVGHIGIRQFLGLCDKRDLNVVFGGNVLKMSSDTGWCDLNLLHRQV